MIRALIGSRAFSETKTIKVTVWNENVYETKSKQVVRKIYPRGIHETIAEGLRPYGFQIRTAVLQQPEQGLSEALLNDTDVLIYWSHLAQEQVLQDEIVDRLQRRVLEGMGLIVLHAAHYSKIFRRLMGAFLQAKIAGMSPERSNGCGSSIPHTLLRKGSDPILNWNRRKCTASFSISLNPIASF